MSTSLADIAEQVYAEQIDPDNDEMFDVMPTALFLFRICKSCNRWTGASAGKPGTGEKARWSSLGSRCKCRATELRAQQSDTMDEGDDDGDAPTD